MAGPILFLSIPFAASNSVPERVMSNFAENWKFNTTSKMYPNWQEAMVGHWIEWMQKAAEHFVGGQVLNPAYISNTGRTAEEMNKLYAQKTIESEQDALNSMAYVMADDAALAKAKMDAVGKTKWSRGVLPMWGIVKEGGKGCVPVMVGLLAEQNSFLMYLNPAAIIDGDLNPTPPIIPVENRIQWKAGQGTITRPCYMVLRGNPPSQYDDVLTNHFTKNLSTPYKTNSTLVIKTSPTPGTYTLDATVRT